MRLVEVVHEDEPTYRDPAAVLHIRDDKPAGLGWFCPVCRCIVTWVNTIARGHGGWERRLERQIERHERDSHGLRMQGVGWAK